MTLFEFITFCELCNLVTSRKDATEYYQNYGDGQYIKAEIKSCNDGYEAHMLYRIMGDTAQIITARLYKLCGDYGWLVVPRADLSHIIEAITDDF